MDTRGKRASAGRHLRVPADPSPLPRTLSKKGLSSKYREAQHESLRGVVRKRRKNNR